MASTSQYRNSHYSQFNHNTNVTPSHNPTYESNLQRRNTVISTAGATPRRDRTSDGTTGSSMASDNENCRESTGTQATELPAYSKKIVVVGDGGCGKTCLLISYSQGYFPEKYVPTVFENYITYPIHPPSGKTVELALWDTAGQEEYDRLRPLSYPETDLIFVCFAIDCPNSLENVVDKWYPEVVHFCPYTPLILVGLKSDLRHKKTCIDMLKTQGLTPVTSEQGMAVAKKMNAQYMECSSKEWVGVEEIFERAILTVVANDRKNMEAQSAASGDRASTARGSSSHGVKKLTGLKGSSKGGGGTTDAYGNIILPPKKKRRNCKIL